MKLNGYKLRNAIQAQAHKRDVLTEQFRQSLKKFPDEEKEHPTELMGAFMASEDAIARLQAAQTLYNTKVMVEFEGKNVPLLFLIKSIGGLGRIEKMWRTATPQRDRYSYRDDDSRNADTVYALPVMKPSEILEMTQRASKRVTTAREAIALGNATEMEIEIDPGLF